MLKKLKVSHKLMLLIGAVALPLTGWTIYATINGVSREIQLAKQEQRGNAFQRPLAALLDALPQHQWLAQAVARGDQAAKTQLLEKEVQIDQHFADLDAVNTRYGADLKFAGQDLGPRTVKAEWQSLKQSAPTGAESAAQHAKLIASVRGLIRHAGETSHLILDPDLDSNHLMDVTLLALPQTQDRLAVVTSYGHDLLRREQNSISAPDLAQLGVYAALIKESDVDRVNASVEGALRADASSFGLSPTLKKNLSGPLQSYNAAHQEFLAVLTSTAAKPASISADAFLAAGQKVRTAAYDLWKASVDELDVLLAQRADAKSHARLIMLVSLALTLVLAVAGAVWMAQGITRPLAGLNQATLRIMRGESSVRAPVQSQDEIGTLASSFNAMLDTRNKVQATVESENKRLQSNIQELLVVVSDASDGKLGVRAKVSEGALGNICDALNLMLENVGGIIANAKSASDQVATASSGITSVAQELEKGEQRQTQEIFTTSEGVRDLNGKAQKVLENCQAATKAAANGRAAAEMGAKAVREVIKGMEKIRENTQANAKKIKRLGDRSMEISGIVKVIGDISAKTDMLALNASIEAARAGEQGRGFTIVAEQVRGLADRTKTLTNQIEKLVGDIQKETGEAVAQMETQTQEVEAGARAAQSAGGTLENIVTVSSESSELVSQINESASQQAVRTKEMLATVENINQVVAESAAKVRETRSTSEQLLALSAELNKRLAQFETATEPVGYELTTN